LNERHWGSPFLFLGDALQVGVLRIGLTAQNRRLILNQ
jgi:hypothetical protein